MSKSGFPMADNSVLMNSFESVLMNSFETVLENVFLSRSIDASRSVLTFRARVTRWCSSETPW